VCNTCGRVYDDDASVCGADGTVLVDAQDGADYARTRPRRAVRRDEFDTIREHTPPAGMPALDPSAGTSDDLDTIPYGEIKADDLRGKLPAGVARKQRRGMKTLPFGRQANASRREPAPPDPCNVSAPTKPFPRPITPDPEALPAHGGRKWERALTPPPTHERLLGGRYALKRKLGEGGFGIVFEAEDERLGKRVAVKMLAPRLADQPAALERFRREALAAGRIGHEGIVNVTDFDQDPDGTYFVAMEFLSGVDLAHAIDRDGPFPPVRALSIAIQAAHALAAAHNKGILHRDLKPGNIFLTHTEFRRDNVKIIDFGMSKLTMHGLDDVSLTRPGQIIGTPFYMAPEQAAEGVIDGRADVYALGGILYEMLTGRPPFTGSGYLEIVYKHLKEEIEPPSLLYPGEPLPTEIDALTLRALAKRPDDRFQSMLEFADAMLYLLSTLDQMAAYHLRPRRR